MAPSPVRQTQEQRRNETERRVLDAAIALIAESGSHSITLAQVGTVAGSSRGIVHQHFGNRRGLLEALMGQLGEIDVPDYRGNALEQIVEMIERYLLTIAEHAPTTRAFVRLWAESMAADPVLNPLFDERDIGFRAQLADLIRNGVADGTIGTQVDAEPAAVMVLGLARGIAVQLMSATPPKPQLRTLIDAAKLTISATLGISDSLRAKGHSRVGRSASDEHSEKG